MDIIINELLNKDKKIIMVGDFNIDFLGNRVNLQLQTMINSYGLEAIVMFQRESVPEVKRP